MNNAALYSQAYHYIRCVYKGHRALLRRLIPSHDSISWVSDNLRESCYLPNLTVLSPKNNSRTIGPLLHAGRLPVDRSVEVNFASQPRGFAMHLARLLPYMLSSMPTQKMPEKVLRTTLILMLCSLKHAAVSSVSQNFITMASLIRRLFKPFRRSRTKPSEQKTSTEPDVQTADTVLAPPPARLTMSETSSATLRPESNDVPHSDVFGHFIPLSVHEDEIQQSDPTSSAPSPDVKAVIGKPILLVMI